MRGDGQTGQAGTTLNDSLVVRLVDKYGNGVPGETVLWSVSDGRLSPQTTTTTKSNGEAAVAWTLGSSLGAQTAVASVSSLGSTITFAATATPGAAPRLAMVTQPSASVESGVPFTTQPSVRLETAQGTPVTTAGVEVTAAIQSGGGALSGTTTVTTNGNGVAQFSDLKISGTSGARTLIFAASGHTTITSSSINVTVSTPSASQSTIAASPSTLAVGEAASVSVTVRDASGRALPGVPVTLLASGSGNSISQPGTTDANGLAVGSFAGSTSGARTISASAGGVTLNQTVTVTVSGTGPSASQTTAKVPKGRRFSFTTIVIESRDALGNRLTQGGYASGFQVTVTGANSANPTVFDNRDGTYTASYFPLTKGNDKISITFNGAPIRGSPFNSKVN
jgi:hypothetical protein